MAASKILQSRGRLLTWCPPSPLPVGVRQHLSGGLRVAGEVYGGQAGISEPSREPGSPTTPWAAPH